MQHELTGNHSNAGRALQRATTAADAASIVTRLYEGPKDTEGEGIRRAESGHGGLRTKLGGEPRRQRRGGRRWCRLVAAWPLATIALLLSALCAGAQPSGEALVCTADEQEPAPCRFQDSINQHQAHVIVFEREGARHTFVAKEQTEWWSGTFDGHPAMGVELNREHMKISTTDLTHRFEWWYPDDEHGTY